MSQNTPSPPGTTPRNRSSQVCLGIALVFLIQCVAFLSIILLSQSAWGTEFIKANPGHAFVGVAEGVVELTILFVPLDLLAGLLAIHFGASGLRDSRRLPGGPGKTMSKVGIAMGILLLVLPFVVLLSWASGFRQ